MSDTESTVQYILSGEYSDSPMDSNAFVYVVFLPPTAYYQVYPKTLPGHKARFAGKLHIVRTCNPLVRRGDIRYGKAQPS